MLKKSQKIFQHHSTTSEHGSKKNHSKKTAGKKSFFYALAAYLLLLCVILTFAYHDQASYLDRKRLEMEAVAYEIETDFSNTLGYAESILNHINHQINSSKVTNDKIAKILSSYDQSHYGYNSIKDVLSAGMFYWVDANKHLMVSSAGIIANPIDLSSRDYLVNTARDPLKIYTGAPIIGAVSGQYVIPAGVGALSNNDTYIGTSVVSFNVLSLVNKFKHLSELYKADFEILNPQNESLLRSFDAALGERENLNFAFSHLDGHFTLIKNFKDHPYKIAVSYKNSAIAKGIFFAVLPRLIELLIISLLFFIMVRKSFSRLRS